MSPNKTLKYLLVVVIFLFVTIISLLVLIVFAEKGLDDYCFEINHLQTRLTRCQELSSYVPAMEQVLPPLVLAQLKAVTEQIKQKRHREYERYEQPL